MGGKPSYFDSKYDGLDLREKERQVERDRLLYEQKKATQNLIDIENERIHIEEQRLKEEKNNAEIIAKATRQAEEDRYRNELDIEENRYRNELDIEMNRAATEHILERERQEHEEIMRHKKMCSDLGMDYNEILKFKHILDEWNINIYRQWNKLNSEMEQVLEQMTILAKNKKSYNTISSINKLEEELEDIEKEYNQEQKKLDECLKKDKEYIDSLPKPKSSFLTKLLGLTPKENNNVVYTESEDTKEHRERVEELNCKIQEMKKKIIELENLYDEEEKQEPEITEKIDILWKKRIELLNKLEELSKENEKYAIKRYGHDEFNEFRKNYYNVDIERLLRRIEFGFREKGFDTIRQEDVIKNGTVEDYLNFIENVITL